MEQLKQFLSGLPADHTLGDDEIKAQFMAQPSLYRDVSARDVGNWLAGGGRLAKLKGFIASTQTDEQIIGLQSAVDTLLIMLTANGVSLDVSPNGEHRAMLEALVVIEVLTGDDRDALLTKSWPDFLSPTPADIMAAKQAIEDEKTISTNTTRLSDAISFAHTKNQELGSDEEIAKAFLAEFVPDVNFDDVVWS